MLEKLGRPQPGPTPLKTDNSTATGFVHITIRQRQSKAWDMRYHWLRDRTILEQIAIYCDNDSKYLADYHTKHHPADYHRAIRPKYILSGHDIFQHLNLVFENTWRGCIDALPWRAHIHVSLTPQIAAGPHKIQNIAAAISVSFCNSYLINLVR